VERAINQVGLATSATRADLQTASTFWLAMATEIIPAGPSQRPLGQSRARCPTLLRIGGVLARLDGETSNYLFEVLSDWEAQLRHHHQSNTDGGEAWPKNQ
jgi:hypothetical protein